jgi:cbb3-type cytochrome oxidase subunit 3
MSTLAVVLIAVGAVFLLLFLGGLVLTLRRQRREGSAQARHIAEADRALERARASDRGWDREALERAARAAIAAERPGWRYDQLHLVLVDDRPGVNEDRAHIVATSRDGDLRIVLLRREEGWALERMA